jgi:ubiquitin C-terminal hydrolase
MTSLDDSLLKFMEKTPILKGYKCPNCQTLESSSQRMLLESAPEVLFVQFNRWSTNYRQPGKKDTTVVDVSSQSLILPVRVDKSRLELVNYKLKAVICHVGSTGGGHYSTYAQHGGRWYRLNDSQVRLLKEMEVKNSICTRDAYMLVFEKKRGF